MSVHSKDGETWSTKLDRIGALAISSPNIVFNNLGHIISFDMLFEHYQCLDGNKAVGIDGVSKAKYGENLEHNLKELHTRIRRGTYRSKASRIIEIPKEDGSIRPLAVSCLEDKIVQSVVTTILNKIFEPIFLTCSYGFRTNRNCHEALQALNKATYKFPDGAIVEIDLQKYFNTIPHKVLIECLQKKISDRRFLSLIHKLIKAPIRQGNINVENILGCSQGSIVSPLLANIYLHYVIDIWFDKIKSSYIKGRAEEVRYSDDMVFVFERKKDAERFFEVLPKRLDKYGLKLHQEKSRIITSGKIAAKKAASDGKKLSTYQFLGFTCYWGLSKHGTFWRLKYSSRSDRFREKLKRLRKFLRCNLNATDTDQMLKLVGKVVQGWINYHGISDNERHVRSFICHSKRILFKWFNRRGGKRGMSWEKFIQILERVNYPKCWQTISMF